MEMRGSVFFAAIFLALAATSVSSDDSVSKNVTTSDSTLQTWWHGNGEINYETAVEEQNVRQSHIYSAWVSSNAASSAE